MSTKHEPTGLRANSVRTPGLIAQSLGADEPQLSAVVVVASVALFAGGATPAALLIAAIGIAGFLYLVAKFSAVVGDAGGLYTIATEGLGRRAGAVTGWFMVYGLVLIVPSLFIAAAFLTQAFFAAVTPGMTALSGQWIWWAVVLTTVGLFVVFRGVTVSVTLLLAMTFLGLTALLVFDLAILLQGGLEGIAWGSLLPWNLGGIGATALFAALGLAVYTFGGLEGSVYLAEEAEAPTRTVPRAVLISGGIASGFFILTALAVVSGYGTERVGEEWGTKVSGVLLELSDIYLFPGYGQFLLAMVALSGFSVAIANANSTVRLLYSWAQKGLLPRSLARSHPTHRTPHVATAVVAVAVAVAVVFFFAWQGGSAAGAFNSFTWLSLAGVFGEILAYLMVGVAGFVYGRRHGKGLLFTYVAPILCVTVMGLALVTYFVPAPPVAPFTWTPVVGAGLALVGGIYAVRASTREERGEALPTTLPVQESA
ncbi:APC family permease [Geodermatophilus arenarius]|uniref:APC family permease n=1 Tax=Geodermatophilus arenarius TaxID=1137990 RepID=A0ABV9LDT4_9ACTN